MALRLLPALAGLLFLASPFPAAASDGPVLARVELAGPVETLGLPVRALLADRDGCAYALVVATRTRLDASGTAYRVLADGAPAEGYGLRTSHGRRRPDEERRFRFEASPARPDPAGGMPIPLDRDLILSPPRSPLVGSPEWDPRVAEMVAAVRTEELVSWEARLTGVEPVVVGGLPVTLLTRNTRSGPQVEAATQFVLDELRAMGLSAQFHDWTYAFAANRNVVAELPGGARASEIVLVVAHVDDMPAGGPAPGADDNASGVVGLLAVAKALRGHRFERTIRFLVTTGEEQGLYGSASYVSLLLSRQESPVAVVNMDMIGWNSRGGPVVNLHTRLPGTPGQAADSSIARLFQDVVVWYGLSGELSPREIADGELASDHSKFWAGGIPAILAIEDDLDDFDTAYHSMYDTAARLDYAYLGSFARAAAGTMAHLAAPEGAAHPLLVPVVLSASGEGGSHFTSQVAVANHGSLPAAVTFRYTASAGGGSGSVSLRLAPGVQRLIPDAVEFLRSEGLPIAAEGSRIGTLRVTFEGLSSASDAGVVVRTTTPVPGGQAGWGSAGLAYRGIPAAGLPGDRVVLAALRQNAADRSNVAVLHAGAPGDGPVTLRLTFVEGSSATAMGTLETELAAGAFEQYRLVEISSAAAGREGWVAVERIGGSAAWYAYGVVNDQITSDGSFVSPFVSSGSPAGNASPETILPVVVESGTYSTEVTVTNLSGAARDLLLTYSGRAVLAPTGSASMKLHLENGEQRVFPSFVSALRDSGAPGFVGANLLPFVGPLAVSVPGGTAAGIVVTGRTLNPAEPSAGGGRFGVAYGGVPSGEASEGPVWLLGLQQDEATRSNLAIVNAGEPGSGEIEVRIELFDGETGARAGERVETVPARQLVQVDGILAGLPVPPRQGYARVTRLSGTGRFIAYAVVNDGASPGEGSGEGRMSPRTAGTEASFILRSCSTASRTSGRASGSRTS